VDTSAAAIISFRMIELPFDLGRTSSTLGKTTEKQRVQQADSVATKPQA
jgi:hypothetical protein